MKLEILLNMKATILLNTHRNTEITDVVNLTIQSTLVYVVIVLLDTQRVPYLIESKTNYSEAHRLAEEQIGKYREQGYEVSFLDGVVKKGAVRFKHYFN